MTVQMVGLHYKYNDLIAQVKDTIENFDINHHANIYMSQNTLYKPQRRIENIRQVRALYVDIDCYKTKYSKDATKTKPYIRYRERVKFHMVDRARTLQGIVLVDCNRKVDDYAKIR